MVGSGTDVRSHRQSRIEIGGTPLHIDTLQRIGVVTDPELVEVGQHTVVGTTATTGTCLNGQLRIFGTDALAHLFKAAMKLDVEVALLVSRQVLRTMVHDRHVGIPLDIVDRRVVGH